MTSTSDAEAANYGQTLLSHDQRYQKAAAFIQAVRTLWDSWADDAIVADRESGVYARGECIRYAGIETPWFTSRGPLNLSRPPQGIRSPSRRAVPDRLWRWQHAKPMPSLPLRNRSGLGPGVLRAVKGAGGGAGTCGGQPEDPAGVATGDWAYAERSR
nr:hypothetical protein [Erwinia rhapontici]